MSDTYTAQDVLDYAITGDASKVGDAFKGALADKLHKRLEDKKIEMAQSIFAGSTPISKSTMEPVLEPEQSEPESEKNTETE
tara:strand:- start:633 stop:878 length:246 start_codon:yes stop_codon:yes gene_type:complete